MLLERLYPPPDTTAPSSYNLNTGKVNGKLASLLGHSTGFTIHPHAGAGSICQGGHSQSGTGPVLVSASLALDWNCALMMKAIDRLEAILALPPNLACA